MEISAKDLKRFETKFVQDEDENACWEWVVGVRKDGYGMFNLNGESRLAHQVSYLAYVGELPCKESKLQVCHRCDNHKCVNPGHLVLWNRKSKCQDMKSKGAHLGPTAEEKLESRVNKFGSVHCEHGQCWEYVGLLDRDGYGRVKADNVEHQAHRLAYQTWVGEIPRGLSVLHKCDNRCCVNPKHLWVGTNDENMEDMVSKGRQAKGSRIGSSKLTDEQVRDVRRRYVRIDHNHSNVRELAKEFRVTPECIQMIVRRSCWKHVT